MGEKDGGTPGTTEVHTGVEGRSLMIGPSAVVSALLGLAGAARPVACGAPGKCRWALQRTAFKDSMLRCAVRRP